VFVAMKKVDPYAESAIVKGASISCSSHIVHRGVPTACLCLTVDVHAVLGEVFHYFHHFTVTDENVKFRRWQIYNSFYYIPAENFVTSSHSLKHILR
jgi:hypothetical protein